MCGGGGATAVMCSEGWKLLPVGSRGDTKGIIWDYGHRECLRKCQPHSVRQHTQYNAV